MSGSLPNSQDGSYFGEMPERTKKLTDILPFLTFWLKTIPTFLGLLLKFSDALQEGISNALDSYKKELVAGVVPSSTHDRVTILHDEAEGGGRSLLSWIPQKTG